MYRRALVVFTVAAVVGSVSTDLTACGDKFLRAGRSARTKGYAAIHPASILIYKPNATPKGLKEFESLLRKAGHKPVALKDGASLSQTLSSSKFDVVIADYANRTVIKEQSRGESADAGFLPILHNPSKSQEAEAASQYPCLLKPEKMTKYDALDQIDRLMDLRLKAAAATQAR